MFEVLNGEQMLLCGKTIEDTLNSVANELIPVEGIPDFEVYFGA